jgi:hypothetical protein
MGRFYPKFQARSRAGAAFVYAGIGLKLLASLALTLASRARPGRRPPAP